MEKWKNMIWIVVIAATGCKKPYLPPAITAPNSYLVVEGAINIGADSTVIDLSRTVALSASSTTNPEVGAKISVQSNTNSTYPLTETASGHYTSAGLNLSPEGQYRLQIQTADGKQYASDFVTAEATPAIDTVGFNILSNSLQIYVNSHDATNTVQYYRFDYVETWQFHAEYSSSYLTNGQQEVARTAAQNVYSCFGSDTSSNVILTTTDKLSQDALTQFPLVNLPSTSEKLETRYSIIVREYGLTGDGYNYWQNLKKNTEQLGTIFDAQPSTAGGNIHNVSNPAEPVIGYISACIVRSKRIFINNSQLPAALAWVPVYPYSCILDSAYFVDPRYHGINTVEQFLLMPHAPLEASEAIYLAGSLAGYSGSTSFCIDCTLRGTKTQPSFWK